jgi:hypothetical protein
MNDPKLSPAGLKQINTTFTTDGRQFMWVVFDNDGCECSDFEGIFDSQEKAEVLADKIRTCHREFYAKHIYREWRGSVVVEQVTVNVAHNPYKSEAVDETTS